MKHQKFLFLILIIGVMAAGCSVSKDPMRTQTRLLQKGITKDDTSYIYSLPYATGTCRLLVQAYFSRYSHKNRAALDFKMKKATEVFAARGGIVIRVKEDGYRGGWSRKYRPDGNFIIVQHNDSSRAGYWHLQHDGALVKPGDTVNQGQLLGFSGRTGYALFPHLHFLVWRSGNGGQWQQIATRFQTSKGIVYLRPFRKYCNRTL